MVAGKRLICPSTDLRERGSGVRFRVPLRQREADAFVVRVDGRVYGYLNECGHIPAQLDWLPGEFFDDSKLYLICSVHGALYHPETGACLGGRCQGRGLQALPVCEIDNQIYLDQEDLDG